MFDMQKVDRYKTDDHLQQNISPLLIQVMKIPIVQG